MKSIYRIISIILLSLFFQSQTTIEKGTNEISRTEQKMQGLGKLELVIQNGHTGAVNGILLTKDEKKLISYSADNTIKIWDMKEEKLLKTLEGHAGAVRGILLVNADRMLISYSDDMTLKMWDLETGKTLNYAHQSDKLAFDVQDTHLTRNEKGLFIFDKRQRQISFVDVEGKKVWDWGLRDGIDGLFGLTKDGQKLVSYSRSGIIQIWRINDIGWGELIATMEGHTKKVTGIKLSQDEKKIISYSSDGSIKIWDIENGKLHKTLVEQNAEIKGMQLTKDGAKLIYFDEEAIRILDMQNDRLFKTLEGQSVEKIQLANEDNILISYGKSRIKIWDMNEGKLLKHFGNWYFESSDRYNSYSVGEAGEEEVYFDSREKFEAAIAGLLRMAPRHADKITGVQITSNGRKLISSSADNTIKMWDIKTKNILKSFEAHNDSVNKYIVNNTIIEKIISRYKRGTILAKRNVGGISHFYKTIKFWNTFESRLFEKISIEDSSSLISSLIDIDQNLLFEFHIDGKIDIFDFETRKLLKSLEGHSHTVNGIQLTKDGKKIISYSYDKSIRIWDFESGKLLILFEGHLESVRGIQLTKDEKKIISYSWDNTIKIWELETGKLILNLEWPVYGADGIQLTNDEKKLISYSSLDGIKIWDFENGKILKTIENSYQERIKGIQLTRDGKRLISYSTKIKIWNLEDGKLIIELSEFYQKNLEGWIRQQYLFDNVTVKKIQLSKDEKTLISYSSDNTIKIWDIETGKCLQTLNHNSSNILQVVFKEESTNPNLLTSISSDGSLRYWNIETGKLLVTQLLFKNGHSIYYTPDGYFDYTDKSVLEFISFVSPKIQNNFVDLQDLMNDYYLDGLLELVTNNKFKPNKKNNLTKGVETTAVVKALFETQESVESAEDNKSLHFQITERGSKFEKAVVYVNGIQVDEKTLVDGENTEGVNLEDDSKEGFFKYRVKFSVPLNFGTNRVEVKAYNAFNIPQSFPAFEIQRKIPDNKELAKPDLYILSVGINDYKTKKLTFSVPDAKAMAEALQQGKTGIYHEVFTRLLVDAKKKDIEDALADIEKKARPQDVVLVYFSGHGMNAFTREGKKLFYFVPQDFKWPDDPENENVARNQGIDADYLDETFTKIKSHKLILILDACHSGSVNTALASRGQDKEKATRKAMEKMANGTGRFIFASSSGNEESREHSEVGHGLYTHVFLNALGKSKDKNITDADSINKDGFIYLSEIRSYIEQQFEEQTAKYLKGVIQTPPSMSLGRNGMHERVNDFPLLKK